MQLDNSLSWLALSLTPGLAARLCSPVLRQCGLPDGVFRASWSDLEANAAPTSASSRCARMPRLRIFLCAAGSLREGLWAW